MESKEREWLRKKIGVISASELHLLMSKSGKFTDGNITYLRKIERQRYLKEPAPRVYSKAMQFGTDNEPYAVEWLRHNTFYKIVHCDVDLPEKVFKKTRWGLGASPDCFADKDTLVEIKCVYGEAETNLIFSPSASYEKKLNHCFSEHKDQMIGQLLVYPKIKKIILFKYDPQDDENEFDLRSALDPSRGIMFEFTREDFGNALESTKNRVIFADKYLKSGKDLELINEEWNYLTKD